MQKIIAQFVTELVVHFRNILVCNTIEDAFSLLDISSEEYQQLQLQSKKMSMGNHKQDIYFGLFPV